MKKENSNFKINVLSINTENNDLVRQSSLTVSTHNVEKKYMILSKNNFEDNSKLVNVGIFNRKTQYRKNKSS